VLALLILILIVILLHQSGRVRVLRHTGTVQVCELSVTAVSPQPVNGTQRS